MLGLGRKKSARNLGEDARAGASSTPSDLPSYPTGNLHQSSTADSRDSPGLPDVRLSGFDFEKIINGMGSSAKPASPSEVSDDSDTAPETIDGINVKGNYRNSPRPYQAPPISSPTRLTSHSGASPSSGPTANYPSYPADGFTSTTHQSSPRRHPAGASGNGGYFRAGDGIHGQEASGRASMAKSRSQDRYGTHIDHSRAPHGLNSPSSSSSQRSRPTQQQRAYSHRSSADYYAAVPVAQLPPAAAAPKDEGIAQWVARASETDDQRRAREWEEARERQHAADRKERYEVKAKQAEEESARRRAEFEEMERNEAIAARQRAEEFARKRQEEEENKKRALAAARVERERQEREEEAARLREQERRWQERQARKKEEEAKRREQERLRQEEEEKRRREEAARWAEQVARKQEEERLRREAEEQDRLKRAAEAKRRFELAEAARIKADQEAEKARKQAEEEAAKRRAEAEAARIKAEKQAEEARKRAEEEAERRRVAAEEARIKAEKEAEEARIKAEKEAEEARIRAAKKAEEDRLRALEEARLARLKAIEDAEKARLKAIEDAEKARLKAIEDEKKRIEKAKKDYIRAIANGHAAIEEEDRISIERAQQESERARQEWAKVRAEYERARNAYNRRIAWMEHQQQGRGHGSQDHYSSDSGVSLPSTTGHENHQPHKMLGNDGSPIPGEMSQSQPLQRIPWQGQGPAPSPLIASPTEPSQGPQRISWQGPGPGQGPVPAPNMNGQNQSTPQRLQRIPWYEPAQEQGPAPIMNGHNQSVPQGFQRSPWHGQGQAPAPPMGTPNESAQQGPKPSTNDEPSRNVAFAPSMQGLPSRDSAQPMIRFHNHVDPQGLLPPVAPTVPARRRKRNHLRFSSALLTGARGVPQSAAAKSGLNFAPAVRAPWDAGIIGEGALPDYNPATLASVALSVAMADVSDPTKPILSNGWQSHGYGDPSLITSHYKVVEVQDTRLVKRRVVKDAETGERQTRDYDAIFDALADPSEFEEVWEPFTREELVFDLFGALFSQTSPDVLDSIVAHLDCADIKALRQTCSEVRTALDGSVGREVILRRFLHPIGYQTWQDIKTVHTRTSSDVSAASSASSAPPPPKADALPERDPLSLSLLDIEGFLLSTEIFPEYISVAADWLALPHEMDAKFPRLARASTRAFSRVLTRLRLQPSYKMPPAASRPPPGSSAASIRSVSGASSSIPGKPAAGLAASPLLNMSMFSPTPSANGPMSPDAQSISSFAQPQQGNTPSVAPIASPWKPGRVAVYRVWVPCRDRVWLSDEEIAKCERELFLASVWSHLKPGDIIRNTAMVDEANVGKLIFDGKYLRDLSFAFDRIGHMPSWLNLFLYPPAYYHNVIRSSTPSPVLYLDVLPWREQIVSSLRLVQDQVETIAPNGARYRIAKWLYRTVANVKASQIISDEGFQCVDEGWEGKLVFETEGTSEHAKDLIARCAGPTATAQTKAKILAAVLGGDAAAGGGGKAGIAGTRDTAMALLKNPAVKDREGKVVQAQTPFAVLRDRSKPGLIWLRPIQERERLT